MGSVITILLLLTHTGYGSSPICIESSVPAKQAELLAQYQAVFSGEVIAIKHGDGFDEVEFEVWRAWEGAGSAKMIVGAGGDSYEGITFETGERYLVFANGTGTGLWNASCSRTKKLSEALPELKLLGEGKVADKEALKNSGRMPPGP